MLKAYREAHRPSGWIILDLADNGRTQQQVAKVMGWSRDNVTKHFALRNICAEAWGIIVTSTEEAVTDGTEGGVTINVTAVTFSENLLRSILPLTPDQQVELVNDLAGPGPFDRWQGLDDER